MASVGTRTIEGFRSTLGNMLVYVVDGNDGQRWPLTNLIEPPEGSSFSVGVVGDKGCVLLAYAILTNLGMDASEASSRELAARVVCTLPKGRRWSLAEGDVRPPVVA